MELILLLDLLKSIVLYDSATVTYFIGSCTYIFNFYDYFWRIIEVIGIILSFYSDYFCYEVFMEAWIDLILEGQNS